VPHVRSRLRMVVTVENEKPVAVEGSRKHPFNQGWLCAKGRAALEFFSSPSRLKSPMIRKGSGFEEASWEDALAYASEKMRRLRETCGPQSLAIYYGEGVGHQEIRSYMKRFANVYGTPNFCGVGSICNTARTIAETLTFGGLTKPDIPNTRLLIVWGANPLISHEPCPPAEIEKLRKREDNSLLWIPGKLRRQESPSPCRRETRDGRGADPERAARHLSRRTMGPIVRGEMGPGLSRVLRSGETSSVLP